MTSAAHVPALEKRRVGRYELRSRLAQGGMASVYLGCLSAGHGFERWVAVKVMHPHLAEDRRFVNMFLDEARLVARIQHPNVCSVIDFGEESGLLYLVMEYLHGESLASVIRRGVRRGGLPKWLAARTIADTARGLHAAHEHRDSSGQPLGIVHRDVSPQNVHVLYDGVAKIVDFGVARARGRITSTGSGEVKGKFSYMSPEQLRGETIDRRTDLWALGVVLWEAALGRRLFRGESHGQTAIAVLQQRIPAPSELDPGFPPLLEEAVMGSLERDPRNRIASAAELADMLDRYLKGEPDLSGPAQVASWMNEVFADRRDLRAEHLHSDVTAIPFGAGDLIESHSTLGSLAAAADEAPTRAITPQGTEVARPAGVATGRARRTVRWLVLAAALVALAAVGLVYSSGRGASGPAGGSAGGVAVQEGPGNTIRPSGEGAEAPGSEGEPPEQAPPASVPHEPATEEAPERADEVVSPELGSAAEAAADDPPTERREPRRSGPRAPGSLSLLALPAAEVSWRGRSLGRTPLVDTRMPAGRHTLTLRPLSGGASQRITVVIRPGQPTRRSIRLGSD